MLAKLVTNGKPWPRPVRVLWLSHFVPYPPKGGNLQRTHGLLREAARRYEVHLLALNQRPILSSPDDVSSAVNELSRFCTSVEVFEIPWDRTRQRLMLLAAASHLLPQPYDVYWLSSRMLRKRCAFLARNSAAFDLVHVDTAALWQYVGPFRSRPIVVNHHNVESHMMARRAARESGRLRRLYFEREARKLIDLERLVCPSAAMNLVVSPLDAERLRALVGEVCTAVVDNGVDTEYFSPAADRGHSNGGLVFAGRLSAYANNDAVRFLLGEIWPTLCVDGRARALTIIGKAPPKDIVTAAQALPGVRLLGFVDDVRPYLDAASIYVCPIRDGGGTRLKVLDALAMAKPLIATRLAVEGLDLTPGRHFLAAESAAEFAQAIRRLEADSALREQLAREGRQVAVGRYSWTVVGVRLAESYERAVADAGSVQFGPAVTPWLERADR